MTISNELPAAAGNGRLITLWTPSLITALTFIWAAGSKLAGAPAMAAIFDKVGGGQWFRYFTAPLELPAGIGLLVSRHALYATVALAVVVIGASVAQLTVLAGSPGAPIALLVIIGVVGYLRKRAHLLTAGGNQVRR